jgi:eukaryotic-like serine/threonine-protein kinase
MDQNVAHLPEGTVIAGKFRILRLLGMGGMGAVYEIEHELTKHRRALKMLHAQFRAYPNVIARFLREASAAGRIGNPHIIETFDAGELESGEPYLIMEYLEGETLSDRLGRSGRLNLDELVELIGQACEGIQAAHERGIVHRDLKPENLYIVTRDARPFVKILDFGVSKFDSELTGALGVTKEGSTIGTPFYMPPEQIRGEKDIDARADVYALGVILYECASGKRPFEADTLPHLAVLIHEGKPVPLEELRPDLPRGFIELVTRAMASQRADRFASARELAQALRPFGGPSLDATVEHASQGGTPFVVRPATGEPPVARSKTGPSMPGSSISIADAPPRSGGRGMLIGAGVAIVVGAGALAAIKLTSREPAKEPGLAITAVAPPSAVAPASPPPSAQPAPTPTLAAAPAPTPEPAKPDAGAESAPHVAGRPAAPPARNPPSNRSPTPQPATGPGSRAEQKGLANDNPFK